MLDGEYQIMFCTLLNLIFFQLEKEKHKNKYKLALEWLTQPLMSAT